LLFFKHQQADDFNVFAFEVLAGMRCARMDAMRHIRARIKEIRMNGRNFIALESHPLRLLLCSALPAG